MEGVVICESGACGGIVGRNFGEISDCSFSGRIIDRAVHVSKQIGGIVGYVGTAPYFTINSGERTVNNINVDDAIVNIVDCTSTGHLIHKEARFAEDV